MNDMYMVRVRPRGRAMEKGAEGIVWVRYMDVPEMN
jgi:hypothetical protein